MSTRQGYDLLVSEAHLSPVRVCMSGQDRALKRVQLYVRDRISDECDRRLCRHQANGHPVCNFPLNHPLDPVAKGSDTGPVIRNPRNTEER